MRGIRKPLDENHLVLVEPCSSLNFLVSRASGGPLDSRLWRPQAFIDIYTHDINYYYCRSWRKQGKRGPWSI